MTEDLLVRRIEETCSGIGVPLTGHEDVLWHVPLHGVTARCSTLNDSGLNMVGLAKLSAESADSGIAAVVDYYQSQEKLVSWIVGPSSTPQDLGERLLAHGFVLDREECMWGMALQPLELAAPAPPGITVRRVSADEAAAHQSMMARAYGYGTTAEGLGAMMRLGAALGPQAAIYLAWAEGLPSPAGWSFAFFHADGETLVLDGSATLPTHRHRGVYTAMVAERLRGGRTRGYTTAVVQAVRGTSAPICAQLGFRIVCALDMYLWHPRAPRL